MGEGELRQEGDSRVFHGEPGGENWRQSPREPELAGGEIHVWRAWLDTDEFRLAQLAQTLAADERDRAGRFHFPKDRNRFIAARARLRAILARYLRCTPGELRFEYSSQGKPRLSHAGGVEFNLAHSGELALYAVTRGRQVGVDVEHMLSREPALEIADRFFSREEAAILRALPPDQRQRAFFLCWTRKEAFLKATGMGISFGLDQFTVSLSPGAPAAVLSTAFDPIEARRWSLEHLEPGPGYVGALAGEGEISGLKLWQWTDR